MTEKVVNEAKLFEKFVYGSIPAVECDNSKCEIMKMNAMACGKKPVAFIYETPVDFMVETRGCYICQHHLSLTLAAAERFKVKVEEKKNVNDDSSTKPA